MAPTALDLAREVSQGAQFGDVASLTTGDEGSQLLTLLNNAGGALASMRGPNSGSWPELERTYTWVADGGAVSLPAGYKDLIPGTVQNTSQGHRRYARVSPQEWSRDPRWAGLGVGQFRIISDGSILELHVRPTPDLGDEMEFQYVSSFWARESDGGEITLEKVTRDSDVPVFDERLMRLSLSWRLRAVRGLEYASKLGEYEQQRDMIFVRATGPSDVQTFGGSVYGRPEHNLDPSGSWGLG